MKRFLTVIVVHLPLAFSEAFAQKGDADYCAELAALANKFASGGDGRSFPDLFTQEAIGDCQKSNYAKDIPVLEQGLRSSRVSLPSR